MKRKALKKNKGMAIGIVMMVTLVLVILTTALVITNLFNLTMSSRYRDRVIAMDLAQAGLMEVLDELGRNPQFAGDITSKDRTPGGYYEITFNRDNPDNKYFSVNNVPPPPPAPAPVATPNFKGDAVPPGALDLVVTARTSSITRRVHVFMVPCLPSDKALVAGGQIEFDGHCKIGGVKQYPSMNTDEVPGKIHSNYQSVDENDFAIKMANNATFTINEGGEVTSVNGFNPHPIDENIRNSVRRSGGKVNEMSPKVPVENIDVVGTVQDKLRSVSSTPPFVSPSQIAEPQEGVPPEDWKKYYVSGGSGTTEITQDSVVDGNYVVVGTLKLNGNLYVNGDLKIYGSIEGNGAIYVNGKTRILGGSATVVSGSKDGATIFSEGDITVEKLEVQKYYDALRTFIPSVGQAMNHLQSVCDQLISAMDDKNEADVFHALEYLGAGVNGSDPNYDPGFVQLTDKTMTGKTMYINQDSDFGKLIQLMRQIDDQRTKDIVLAIDKKSSQFRCGRYVEYGFFSDEWLWDDDSWSETEWHFIFPETIVHQGESNVDKTSFMRQYFLACRNEGRTGVNGESIDPGDSLRDNSDFKLANFYANVQKKIDDEKLGNISLSFDPDDFVDWDKGNYFQGVLYSRKNINVLNGTKIVGIARCLESIKLSGDTEIIYNEEYAKRITSNTTFLVKYWEEL